MWVRFECCVTLMAPGIRWVRRFWVRLRLKMLVGVAISDDGQKLAVSFPGESTWRGEDYGVVRIYAWDGSSWVQQDRTFISRAIERV